MGRILAKINYRDRVFTFFERCAPARTYYIKYTHIHTHILGKIVRRNYIMGRNATKNANVTKNNVIARDVTFKDGSISYRLVIRQLYDNIFAR